LELLEKTETDEERKNKLKKIRTEIARLEPNTMKAELYRAYEISAVDYDKDKDKIYTNIGNRDATIRYKFTSTESIDTWATELLELLKSVGNVTVKNNYIDTIMYLLSFANQCINKTEKQKTESDA
jgi:hypothetical protein